MNHDDSINVLDVVRTANIILDVPPEPTEYELWSADFNEDNLINTQDVILIVNMDGLVNVVDIIISVTYIIDGQYFILADINLDGMVNILDIILIVNIILG